MNGGEVCSNGKQAVHVTGHLRFPVLVLAIKYLDNIRTKTCHQKTFVSLFHNIALYIFFLNGMVGMVPRCIFSNTTCILTLL